MKIARFFLALASGLLVCSSPVWAADPEPAGASSPESTAAAGPELPAVVATVDGHEIKREEVESALKNALSSAGRTATDLPPEQRATAYRMITEDLVMRQVVAEKAKGIEVSDAQVEAELAKIQQQIGSEEEMKKIEEAGETMESVKKDIRQSLQEQKWIEQQVADKGNVTEEAAKEFYDKTPDQFQAPDMVRASHVLITVPTGADEKILAEKKAEAEKAKERVEGGEDFAKVAAEVSEDPGSKTSGGDLNFFTKDRMVPEFAEAAFSLEKGKVSDPVKTQFGYHIIKVTDKKEARTVPFEEAKDRIIGYLGEQKRREAVEAVVQKARAESDVKINLPPEPAAASSPAASPAPEGKAAAE